MDPIQLAALDNHEVQHWYVAKLPQIVAICSAGIALLLWASLVSVSDPVGGFPRWVDILLGLEVLGWCGLSILVPAWVLCDRAGKARAMTRSRPGPESSFRILGCYGALLVGVGEALITSLWLARQIPGHMAWQVPIVVIVYAPFVWGAPGGLLYACLALTGLVVERSRSSASRGGASRGLKPALPLIAFVILDLLGSGWMLLQIRRSEREEKRARLQVAERLLELGHSSDMEVVRRVAGDRAAPPQLLRELAEANGDPDHLPIRKAVALNPHTPPEVLAEIFGLGPADDVNWCLAWNPSTPPEILRQLSTVAPDGPTGRNCVVLQAVARNRGTPPDVAQSLLDARRQCDRRHSVQPHSASGASP